ncbi:MAG: DUF2924 domain-containing protein [Sedimenticola sp.]
MSIALPSIEQLESLPLSKLKHLYLELIGIIPPSRSGRNFLIGNIAWTIQALNHGQDPAKMRKRLIGTSTKQAISQKTKYLPGTRLIREWQGITHEVVVEESGFRWQQTQYSSLSHIAREITGTRWSGPRFFGLKERPSPESASKVPE